MAARKPAAKATAPAQGALIIPFPANRSRRSKSASFSADWQEGLFAGLNLAAELVRVGLPGKGGSR